MYPPVAGPVRYPMTPSTPPPDRGPEPDPIVRLHRPGPGYRLAFVAIPLLLERTLIPSIASTYRTAPPRAFEPQEFRERFLGADEMATLNGFKALKKQVEWMAGRYAAKQLAKAFLRHRPPLDQVRVAYRAKGAPYFIDDSSLCLSISHSGDYAAAGMGLTPSCALGLDLELIRPESRPTLLKTAFTAREAAILRPLDDAALFQHWTAKEAYLKYIGMGFHESLKRVEIIDGAIFHDGYPVPSLSLSCHLPFPGYAFAMVT